MIAALAGRRVDAPDTKTPRFPATHIESIERAIRQQLAADQVRVLVCAAACGADLLALAAANELGLRRRIVLPFAIELFRERSVADRPGPYPWGELYDRLVREAKDAHDLRLLGFDPDDPTVYEKTNVAILEEALSVAIGTGDETEAIVVWDSHLRTEHDYTEQFAQEAQRRRIPVKSIAILG